MAQAQSVTIDQLARLYGARNEANNRLTLAHRAGSKAGSISDARKTARTMNAAYESALKQYKHQQKTAMKARRSNEEADRKEAAAETTVPDQGAA